MIEKAKTLVVKVGSSLVTNEGRGLDAAAVGRWAAQVLLTHADLADRQRYLNARSTLRTLLDMGVIR